MDDRPNRLDSELNNNLLSHCSESGLYRTLRCWCETSWAEGSHGERLKLCDGCDELLADQGSKNGGKNGTGRR